MKAVPALGSSFNLRVSNVAALVHVSPGFTEVSRADQITLRLFSLIQLRGCYYVFNGGLQEQTLHFPFNHKTEDPVFLVQCRNFSFPRNHCPVPFCCASTALACIMFGSTGLSRRKSL